jgi:hypothetical protein
MNNFYFYVGSFQVMTDHISAAVVSDLNLVGGGGYH